MGDTLDPRKLIAEAIGVFTLVFIGGGAVLLSATNANIGLLEIALAHGLAIAVMISAFGGISGGHFNPAVTVGMWVTRRIDSLGALGYIVAQFVGGIVGALALRGLFPSGMVDAGNLATPALGPATDVLPAVGIEAILTFFLVIVIFGVAVDRRGPKVVAGLAIGLTISMDILAGGPLTGAVMNPARALGPALVSGNWADQMVWWVGPLIGGVVAALVYHYVFAEQAEEQAT